ncbi:hypothetical protein K458DRAFT_443467 [Lentithecium fluviatile CBS 122367]|uniref:Serine-threonine protein kinase 19 n=1 Tax=Lentithecium fluviatile CBS 122367 TaxID=1168545 RepID=A0A6G1IZI3_9PLEO|nr:hypothetical protein K458DRAFT_443467 [Lentithecium fluviatile CBS 122367]
MSFQTTAARSSRIRRAKKPSVAAALGLRRATSSPSAASPRRKPSQSPKTDAFDEDEKLEDTGIIASLTSDLNFRDVPQYMEYIRSRMFSDVPEKAAGMNSTRVAEVLNLRKALPPIATIAHVDALGASSTRTEREIVELAQAGVLRRVVIPHRGVGAAAVGDGLVSVKDWRRLVLIHPDLNGELKSKYLSVMEAGPISSTVASTAFTPVELSALTAAGFLTTTTPPDTRSSLFAAPGAGSLSSLSTAGSRHAAGSLAAVGGPSASQHIPGGVPGQRPATATYYNFSLPNTGSHMKLLIEARTHLLNLLKKAKHKEAPLDVLRQKWDGGVTGTDEITEKKKARGEFAGILPGRTKKWKQFYGLRFEWILEECVGAGLVELFETRSVGRAVRVA